MGLGITFAQMIRIRPEDTTRLINNINKCKITPIKNCKCLDNSHSIQELHNSLFLQLCGVDIGSRSSNLAQTHKTWQWLDILQFSKNSLNSKQDNLLGITHQSPAATKNLLHKEMQSLTKKLVMKAYIHHEGKDYLSISFQIICELSWIVLEWVCRFLILCTLYDK